MRPIVTLSLALSVLTAVGCGSGGSSTRRGSTTAPASSSTPSATRSSALTVSTSPPVARILELDRQPTAPPPHLTTDTVEVGYQLVDADADLVAVAVEFSFDGLQWFPATRAAGQGDATTGLGSSPRGVNYRFVWNALADLGPAAAQVELRITPSDGAPGLADSAAFTIDLGAFLPVTPHAPPASPTSPANPPAPSAASLFQILPTLGARGRSVRIRGSGFSPSLSDNAVWFAGVPAQVVLARTDELVVATPTAVPLGIAPVRVEVLGIPATPTLSFRFLADAQVLSVTPDTAAPGDLITIVGSDFDALPNGVVVRFSGGVSVVGTARGAGMIQVTVPGGAQTGTLYVVTHGATSNSVPFTVGTTAPTSPTPPPPAPPPAAPSGSAPQILSVGTPAGTAQDLVPMPYTVRDADGDRVRIEVEYQLGLGPWQSATAHTSSDPTRDVLAPAGGATYAFVWDSIADTGITSGPRTARLRARASDASGASSWQSTATFALANVAPPSQPPAAGSNSPPDVLSVGTPASPQAALVTIPYTVADPEADAVTIEVRYMLSALTGWQTCTAHLTSDPTANVATSVTGRSYTFVWDARADLGFVLTSAVIVQVRARDAVLGPGRTTGSFRVDTR